jgi:hypothetical protein
VIALSERLNLRRGFDSAISDNPLKHVDAVLKLLHLQAQKRILFSLSLVSFPTIPPVAHAHAMPEKTEHEHHEQHGKDEFKGVHLALSPGIRMISLRGALDSSGGFASRFGLAPEARRLLSERLDLRSRLRTAVGDDLLEHTDPLFELARVGSILRRFFGGIVRFHLKLLFAKPEISVGDEHQQHDRQSDADQRDENFRGSH